MDAVTFTVVSTERMDNGHLWVTYSVASGVHVGAEVIPGADAAHAVKLIGDHLYEQYQSRGYV